VEDQDLWEWELAPPVLETSVSVKQFTVALRKNQSLNTVLITEENKFRGGFRSSRSRKEGSY
jgi:hypothetical protein